MTQDEIIEIARQAGMVQDGDVWFSVNNYEQCDVHIAELEAFAKQVADVAIAKEREACAKVCETFTGSYERGKEMEACAAAIRARGEA